MRTGRGLPRPVECLALDQRNYFASTLLFQAGQRQENMTAATSAIASPIGHQTPLRGASCRVAVLTG
jgi:hypothetical protein